MTFDFPPTEETGDDAETPNDSVFTEEEWVAIEALSEPGAIF
ncbi:hypothetical protein KUL17_00010 [Alteromonas sp. KUL17]|nr:MULTISPECIES: hypothetical protein [Alteromonas]GEA01104.1 hypothetical protein KUL17_00010 [Alteromonas sp. KUL17]